MNTGAIDDLSALADLCREQELWFHVDGAFGALAAISDRLRPLIAGMERADSLAFDLHKWMYMPYEVGCALVRDPERHREAFTVPASYLAHAERGTAAVDRTGSAITGCSSRAASARSRCGCRSRSTASGSTRALIEQNVEQAHYLAGRVSASPELELMAPVPLNIVCFRFKAARLSEEALDRLNQDLLVELQENGVAVPTSTVLDGRYAIRVANVNHRSRREDFDLLLREVLERGRRLAGRAGSD